MSLSDGQLQALCLCMHSDLIAPLAPDLADLMASAHHLMLPKTCPPPPPQHVRTYVCITTHLSLGITRVTAWLDDGEEEP